MAEQFTPQVHLPRWLMFSKLPEVIGATNWLVFLALVWTQSRLLKLQDPKWKAEEFDAPFKVRVRTELGPQTGLSARTVSRALIALDKWKLIILQSGGGRNFTRIEINHKTVWALAQFCMPRLPGYQGGFKGKGEITNQMPYWLASGWGWRVEPAKAEQARVKDDPPFTWIDIRGVLVQCGGEEMTKPKLRPKPRRKRSAAKVDEPF